VAEGEGGEVERFVQAIQDEMGEYIRDQQATTSPANGEFGDFGVRY